MGLTNKGHYKWDDSFGKDIQQKALDKLEIQGQLILAEAKKETPVDLGPLRDSGKVDQDKSGKCVWISFGNGPSAKYAIKQHERLDYHHTVGKAKYLADPFNRMKDAAIKSVIDELKGG